MRLQYVDGTCIGITSEEGVVIVVDPVEIGGFGGPGEEARIWADIALVTRGKGGPEGGLRSLKGDPITIDGPGRQEIKGIQITGISCEEPGAVEGGKPPVTVFLLAMDGLRLLHLGMLAHVPSQAFRKEVGPIDVLFLPVAGYGTLNSTSADEVIEMMGPRVAVAMHRPAGAMGFDVENVNIFLTGKKGVKKLPSKTQISKNSLPNSREIWIMEPTK